MTDNKCYAPSISARSRSPDLVEKNSSVSKENLFTVLAGNYISEMKMVEDVSPAEDSHTTKFHAENNRERRLMVSTL